MQYGTGRRHALPWGFCGSVWGVGWVGGFCCITGLLAHTMNNRQPYATLLAPHPPQKKRCNDHNAPVQLKVFFGQIATQL